MSSNLRIPLKPANDGPGAGSLRHARRLSSDRLVIVWSLFRFRVGMQAGFRLIGCDNKLKRPPSCTLAAIIISSLQRPFLLSPFVYFMQCNTYTILSAERLRKRHPTSPVPLRRRREFS